MTSEAIINIDINFLPHLLKGVITYNSTIIENPTVKYHAPYLSLP